MYDNAAKITRSKVKTSSVFMGITLLYKLEGSIMIGHPFSFYFWYTIILYIKFKDKYRGETTSTMKMCSPRHHVRLGWGFCIMYASAGHETSHNHTYFDWFRYEIIEE